jgi:predicted lysophospholipase L1 biosynthesis ABC-type transport system permease subunit
VSQPGGGRALVGVAAWQAGSLRVGLMLSGGFVGDQRSCCIWQVWPWSARCSRFATRPRSRCARPVLHIARPANQTRVILLAVGLGTFFILGVRTLQANLLQDFAVQVGDDAPTCS